MRTLLPICVELAAVSGRVLGGRSALIALKIAIIIATAVTDNLTILRAWAPHDTVSISRSSAVMVVATYALQNWHFKIGGAFT